MKGVAAGMLAASAVFLANRFLYRVFRDRALAGAVPLTEEVAKTAAAYILGAGIIHTHLVFGLVEALLDWRGENKSLPAAGAAILSHGVFGLVTVAVLNLTAMPGLAIVAAFVLHAFWNVFVLLRPLKR
jgi:hypothetical protein